MSGSDGLSLIPHGGVDVAQTTFNAAIKTMAYKHRARTERVGNYWRADAVCGILLDEALALE